MPAIEQAPSEHLVEENARLAARVGELEHLLELERSRNEGLAHGVDTLSQRLSALYADKHPETTGAP